jgi:hypothetical protein
VAAEYKRQFATAGIFSASVVANVLTSAVDVGYLEKELALDILRDVSGYVRRQCEDWEDFAAQFLAGEAALELNDKKGRKILEKFVGYLRSKPGSPWNNVPFEPLGRIADGESAIYAEEEFDRIETHIQTHFGDYETVLHEINSPDIHVDICIVPPTEARPWQTFVTMGMGARRMNVPREIRNLKLDRAALVVALPADWDLSELRAEMEGRGNCPEGRYWPIRWLKVLARLPLESDTWLGYGHSVPSGKPFAEDTKLSSVMLVMPEPYGDAASVCVLPGGDEVNFYQMVPLYESEVAFKKEHGAEALEKRFGEGYNRVIDSRRRPVVEDERRENR